MLDCEKIRGSGRPCNKMAGDLTSMCMLEYCPIEKCLQKDLATNVDQVCSELNISDD